MRANAQQLLPPVPPALPASPLSREEIIPVRLDADNEPELPLAAQATPQPTVLPKHNIVKLQASASLSSHFAIATAAAAWLKCQQNDNPDADLTALNCLMKSYRSYRNSFNLCNIHPSMDEDQTVHLQQSLPAKRQMYNQLLPIQNELLAKIYDIMEAQLDHLKTDQNLTLHKTSRELLNMAQANFESWEPDIIALNSRHYASASQKLVAQLQRWLPFQSSVFAQNHGTITEQFYQINTRTEKLLEQLQ